MLFNIRKLLTYLIHTVYRGTMFTEQESSTAIDALEKMSIDEHYQLSHAEQKAILAFAEEQGLEALRIVTNEIPLSR